MIKGFDKNWRQDWIMIKQVYEMINEKLKLAKQETQDCAMYMSDLESAEEQAMETYFNTSELMLIRTEIEEAQVMEKEL